MSERPSESGIYAGQDLSYLERLCIDAGFCANCCINESLDKDHVDCAGPEGYWCDCPCDGKEINMNDPQQKELTVAQRLVRLALEDKTKVDLADDLDVSRQAVHNWMTGQSDISKKHMAALMAIIGMEEADLEEARKDVLVIRLELEEIKNRLYDTEEKLMEAELELKGFYNGETEREMSAVTMQFAELIERQIGMVKVAMELGRRFTDNKSFSTKELYISAVEDLAKQAAEALGSSA